MNEFSLQSRPPFIVILYFMIYLEVEKSNDPLALGIYEFEFDQISIGRSIKNDLIFLDEELPRNFLLIKFVQGYLIVKNLTRLPFFFVNGKKVSGTLKINVNDTISFGQNQIRVIKFKLSNQPIDFPVFYEKFHQEVPELKFSLDFIEQVLIDLEKDSNV